MQRASGREAAGLPAVWPYAGEDLWTAYEFSWLHANGLPRAAGLRLRVGADSPRMVESKSMKLYLNGFAQQRFESPERVLDVLRGDLSASFAAPVAVELVALDALAPLQPVLPGESLDGLEVETDVYQRDPALLARDRSRVVEESLHSHLFASLCPVTGQPDWASLLIRYRGPALDRAGLLRYLVSYRRHRAFHETTVEQIFLDLMTRGGCEQLLVIGYFTRRGGIDINPLRCTGAPDWPVLRTARQ